MGTNGGPITAWPPPEIPHISRKNDQGDRWGPIFPKILPNALLREKYGKPVPIGPPVQNSAYLWAIWSTGLCAIGPPPVPLQVIVIS